MSTVISNKWVFRIIPIQNLEYILCNGIYCKNSSEHLNNNNDFLTIGSKDVIARRDNTIVQCYPETVVNDYVPFYFSVRTPMLYNIITGRGVTALPQEDIIYLCCRLSELATENFLWCFTDGNAAAAITKFYNKLEEIEYKVDWRSVKTTDFRDDNEDGDEDRVRKKHAEFLVKDYLPVKYIKVIVVMNESKKQEVQAVLDKLKLDIEVKINPESKFYFL